MLMLMMLILLVQMTVMTKWLSPRFKWLSTTGWGGGKEGGGYKGGWGGGEVDGQIQNWEQQQRPNWEKMRNKPSLCLWGYLSHGHSPGEVKVELPKAPGPTDHLQPTSQDEISGKLSSCVSVLKGDLESIKRVAREMVEDGMKQGVKYMEVRTWQSSNLISFSKQVGIDPSKFLAEGLTAKDIVTAALRWAAVAHKILFILLGGWSAV